MALPTTIDEQVNEVKTYEISYRQLHPLAVIQDNINNRNISIPFSSLTNKYRHFLSSIIISVELDDIANVYYRYKPKRVSQDLYNTTELWNDILILNSCVSVMEFDLKKIKAYDPSKLKEYLNEILILEEMLD